MVQNALQFDTDLADGRLPVVLRGLVVLILTGPAIGKFVLYTDRVGRFTQYGIPAPEIMVVVVGVLQLFTVGTVATGVLARVGALVTVPVMVTAMVVASANVANALVLVSCIGIVLIGTGDEYIWDPLGVGEAVTR
ncbi:hypothetical protein EGH22_16160 [Halomicroarcula sp. F28]|uniref:DoxX family protein n=1 Tax=Haloarcula salinisoli TaxID=2487746 RepID=UPI001C72A130|nr:DoxX family membrane protein [Halomicroarcula salinisoli]MBX0287869.1 hypothetical protein [Halomicroarcula salinisoli]